MLWDTLETDIIIFTVGLVIGITITWYYYEKTKNYSIGKVIQGAMISESVDHLLEYSKELSSLLSKIGSESDNLNEQIKRSRDIEFVSNGSKMEENRDNSVVIDSNSATDGENSKTE